jgi:hypothetical protein
LTSSTESAKYIAANDLAKCLRRMVSESPTELILKNCEIKKISEVLFS